MSDGKPQTVRMVDPDGRAHDIPTSEVAAAQAEGFSVEGDDAARARVARELTEEQWSSPAGKFIAGTFAAARGATLGGSDVLIGAVGGRQALQEAKEVNPGLSTGAEIVGAIATLGTSLPSGLAAKAGARVAQAADGASALARIGRGFAGGATEGVLQGAGQGVSEVALSKDPLTFEHAASVIGSNALFGAATGGVAGGAAKGVEIGLGRAKQAIDNFTTARATASELPADIAALDAKGLKVAHDAELEAIEAGRVPQRAQVADEISKHREVLKQEKIWLATKGAEDRELREIGKVSLDADKQLDRLLNNPKALAADPQRAVRALQQQEHALERLEALGRARPDLFESTGGTSPGKVRRARNLPEGWDPDAVVDGGTLFDGKPTLLEGVPTYKGLASKAERENAYIVRPSELGQRKVVGIQSGDDMLADARTLGFKDALEGGGAKLPAVEIQVAKDGTYFVADGNHRVLGAALAGDRPMLVRFKRTAQDHAGMDPIGDQLKAALAGASPPSGAGARAAALETVPVALERNRALQARLSELAAAPKSTRLDAIEAARESLRAGGGKSMAEQMVQGSAFSATAGAISAIPFVGPFLAPIVGAKAANVITDQVFGRLGKATSEATLRGARAASSFLGVAEKAVGKASKVAVPVATKALAAVRYAPANANAAPEKPSKKPSKEAAPSLPALYAARSQEVRSLTQYGPDGRAVMRPEARMALGDALKGIAAVNPILADRIETIRARGIELLANALPRKPDLPGTQLGGVDTWRPPDMEMRTWARLAHAVEDPLGALERAAHGMVTPEDAQAMQTVYPEMLADFVRQVTEQGATLGKPVPYQRRLALSVLTGQPLDPAMDPRVLAVLQGQFAREEGSAGGTQAPTAQPQFGSVKSAPEPTPAQQRAG